MFSHNVPVYETKNCLLKSVAKKKGEIVIKETRYVEGTFKKEKTKKKQTVIWEVHTYLY